MAQKSGKSGSGWSGLIDELKRTIGLLENKVESRTVDGYITLDELDVSKELRAKLKAIDKNGDGKLTLDELQAALRSGLSGEAERVVKEARDTVNQELMQMYSEAMRHFNEHKTKLDQLRVDKVEHFRIPELVTRAEKIHGQLGQILAAMKKKPEIMNLMRKEIRDFMKDVKDVERASKVGP